MCGVIVLINFVGMCEIKRNLNNNNNEEVEEESGRK